MALTMGFVFVSCDKDNNDSEDAVKSYTLSISLDKADSTYLATQGQPYGFYGYSQKDIEIGQFVLTHSFASWGFGEGFTFTSSANDSIGDYSNIAAITAKGVRTNAYFTANAGGANYQERRFSK